MSLRLIAAPALVLCQVAAPVAARAAEAPQFYCHGLAASASGGAVDVQFYVHPDGGVVGRGVLWTPPVIGSDPGMTFRDLSVSVHFEAATARGVGTATEIMLSARASDAKAKAQVMLQFDGRDAEGAPLVAFAPDASLGTFFTAYFRATDEDLRSLASARSLQATINGAQDETVGWIKYDLDGRREVDRLERKAWAQAASLAAHPRDCSETSAPAGDEAAPMVDPPADPRP